MRASKRLALSVLAAGILLLPACNDGHINFLGYTSEPTYDCGIRTVYVPIPQNVTFRRGLEFDLKRAIDREIELKTPFRVASSPDNADTELAVKIVARNKSVVVFNQLNEVRDAETTLTAEVVWRDLRPNRFGDVLNPSPLDRGVRPPPGPLDPLAPPPAPKPVPINAVSSFIPEVGGSITTAEKQMVDRMAVQIVSMMERPW
jgi:hypothetical protein